MTIPLIICQARMDSSRFPGKVLHPLLGQPMILWHLARLKLMQTAYVDVQEQVVGPQMVVATPEMPVNHRLKDVCEKHGTPCVLVPGDPNDVLQRYATVAEQYEAAVIVRTLGDCPLIDPLLIDDMLDAFDTAVPGLDFLGIDNAWPDGADLDIAAGAAVAQAAREATLPSDREHVMPYIWRNTHRFATRAYPCPFDWSAYQYSVDTPQDAVIAEHLLLYALERTGGLHFTTFDLCQIIRKYPWLTEAMHTRGARNPAYVAQVAAEQGGHTWTWDELRQGQPQQRGC